jgi:hypothetical protein
MPGFDGTGPRGKGPMTGKAQGFCLLNIPDDAAEARTGFAGLAGEPVTVGPEFRRMADISLQSRLGALRAGLEKVKSRLAGLEAGGGK